MYPYWSVSDGVTTLLYLSLYEHELQGPSRIGPDCCVVGDLHLF